jgi:hypothetical protein
MRDVRAAEPAAALRAVSRPLGLRVGISLSTLFLGLGVSVLLGETLESMVAFVASMIVTAWLAVRGLRIALMADDRGVLIRNYLRSYRIEWSDIGAVRIGIASSFTMQVSAVLFGQIHRERVVTAQATAGERESRRALDKLSQLRPELPIARAVGD